MLLHICLFIGSVFMLDFDTGCMGTGGGERMLGYFDLKCTLNEAAGPAGL